MQKAQLGVNSSLSDFQLIFKSSLGVFLITYVCFPSYLRIVYVSVLQYNFELLFFSNYLATYSKDKRLKSFKFET